MAVNAGVLRQQNLPVEAVVDTTAYEVVRPGILLRSCQEPDGTNHEILSIASTSGVLVSNASNDVFMTVASRGVGEDKTVCQSLMDGGRYRIR